MDGGGKKVLTLYCIISVGVEGGEKVYTVRLSFASGYL